MISARALDSYETKQRTRSVDQEKERSSFIGDSTSNERFSGTRGSIQQNAARRLDTNCLEQLRMSQGQLNHLTNQRKLLGTATNVFIAHVVQIGLFVFSLDGITLTMDDCVWSNDAIRGWVGVDNFEFNSTHSTTSQKEISFPNRSVCLQKVRLEKDVKQISGETLDSVVNGQHMDALSVGNIWARVDADNIAHTQSQIVAHNSIHSDLFVGAIIVAQNNANRISLASAFQKNCVASKQVQLVHFGL